MTRPWQLLAVALAVGASAARAEIYEWRDASGARHFTNHRAGVPPEHRAAARVLIADWQPAAGAAVPPAVVPAVPPAPPQAPQVVADASYDQGFAAGMHAGMTLGGGGGGSSVQISGPLAVAVSPESGVSPAYPAPGWRPYYPFVTTGFDRGRSRHQTLRMLLQDQFQIDRDGPYAYDRVDAIGLGPALAPFLPRGLPYGIRQGMRVIYR